MKISRILEPRLRKPKAWTDSHRREFAIQLNPLVPLRVHASNGGYLFSLFVDESGRTWRYNDKRWGDRRKINAQQVTWEKPI
jgi:hypothetical protein